MRKMLLKSIAFLGLISLAGAAASAETQDQVSFCITLAGTMGQILAIDTRHLQGELNDHQTIAEIEAVLAKLPTQ